MMSKDYWNRGDSPTDLIRQTQRIHNDMIGVYSEQVRALQIKVALLEDENQKLKDRLVKYED